MDISIGSALACRRHLNQSFTPCDALTPQKQDQSKIAAKKNLRHFCSLRRTVFLAGLSLMQAKG